MLKHLGLVVSQDSKSPRILPSIPGFPELILATGAGRSPTNLHDHCLLPAIWKPQGKRYGLWLQLPSPMAVASASLLNGCSSHRSSQSLGR